MPANKTTDADAADSHAGDASTSLAWGTTAFEPGGDVGLVARHTVGLIERDNPSTRERLWSLVSDDAPLDDILDELSSTGLKALPDFGLAQVEGSAIRVVARGRVVISAELGSGATHDIDPSGVRTWIEELVEDVAAITITLATSDDEAPSGEAFAVLAGSVPASSLSRRYDAPDDHAEATESGAGWTAGTSDNASDSGAAAEAEPAPDVDLEMVENIDEPADAPSADSWFDDQAAEAAAVIPPQPQVDDPSEAERVDDDAVSPVPAAGDPIDITADPVPDDVPPADAPPAGAVPADPQPASPQPPPPAVPAGSPPGGPGAPPPGSTRPDATVVVGSDDGPARGPVSSIFDDDFDDHAAGSASGAPLGDHDGMTAGRADLGAQASPAGDAPVFGVLAFSNGERIAVDRAVLIGRNPKVAGAVEGSLPHIMKFEGPGQGLSRTHAEVRVVDGEVVVEDLQSTNGTEVQLPGQQRRRLRSGEPVVIVPGTLIDFGEELHCTLESAS